MSEGGISVADEGAVRTLTLERPEKRNALTRSMYEELDTAVGAASEDSAVAVIHIRGAGGHFTAGNDLEGLGELVGEGQWGGHPLARFLHGVVDCPKPLIAEVSGYALGIGTTLLLHCDLVIAATDAELGMPFVPMGLVPEFASTELLPALVGPQRAARLMLLGDRFSAMEGERLGVVTQVCEPPAVGPVARAWARRVAGLPVGAVAETRALLRDSGHRERLHAVIEREAAAFLRRLASEEHRTAMASRGR
ncbi:enoyl-CoA hydratase-related protein [Arhodomonas sp. SL1]|uniref:enoyl-CoA hydratase-related protein n=1 Tax=Arhodomonas sp. SL1 TaxID=3425691 RepID=UPI003F883BFF